MLPLLALLATGPEVTTPPPDPIFARMVALYDEVCLQAFPIDGGVDALMAKKGATPLTPEQVKITLGTDPGRGWMLKDGARSVLVFLELPPFHACSVRFPMPQGLGDLSGYRAVADRFESGHPGFGPGPVMDRDLGDLHVHGVTEARQLPSGGGEMLMVVDQHVIDPVRRAKGETGSMVRFVHQIADPDAK